MKTDIWMPFFIGDYLKKTSRFTTEQHGAYLLLIIDYWSNGPLPNDHKILAQITKMSHDAWSIASSIVLSKFALREDYWHHDRIDEELNKAHKRKENAQNRGNKGAAARWGNEINKASIVASIDTTINQASSKQWLGDSSSPSPSPSPSKTQTFKKQARIVLSKPENVSEIVWNDFLSFRQRRKAPITETALKKIENEAAKAKWTLEQALSECVMRGWTGFKAEWVANQNRIFGNKSVDQQLANEKFLNGGSSNVQK